MFQSALGVDQSYTRFGIAFAEDGKLVDVDSLDMTKFGSKIARRKAAKAIIRSWVDRHEPEVVIVERVRLFSQSFISLSTIIALGGLIAVIIDSSYPTVVYSVDTRNWKAKVLGSAKADKDDAVRFVRSLGWDVNHDAADAACMALSAWKKDVKLKEEK